MKNKIETILKDLIELNHPLNILEERLNSISWDTEEDLICLHEENVMHILKKFMDGYLTVDEVERWANLIECRESIRFSNNKIKEIIYELANPDLTFKLEKGRADYLIKILVELKK